MDYKEIYNQWLENPYFDEATKEELKAIKDDENEIKERFYMDLEFGTAGLRGIIGAGTNRMNIYVVRRATQGLANYIAKVDKKSQGVAIAYDSVSYTHLDVYKRQVLPMLFRISFPETKGIIGSLSREVIRQQREDLKFREIQ